MSNSDLSTNPPSGPAGGVVYELDSYDLRAFVEVARDFGSGRYGYVVTPNVDHLIRLRESVSFRESYAGASFVLLDSRVAAFLFRILHRVRAKVCTGSDLTAAVFGDVVAPADRIVLIGGTERQARLLSERFGLRDLRHHNPPMGFIDRPEAVEACLAFVEAASPFRFCMLAVGSPRQELLAQKLSERGRARGLALCIGASIDFLTGGEKRAPRWIQRLGLEWLFRLAQNPRRLAWRYLVRGPKFFLYVLSARVRMRREGGAQA